MPTPPLSRKEALRRVAAVNKALRAGYRPVGVIGHGDAALAVAAVSLGISRQGLSSSLVPAKHLYGIEPDWGLWKGPGEAKEITSAAARLERQAAETAKRLRAAEQELAAGADLRHAVFGLRDQEIKPPAWTVPVKPPSGGPGIPILFTSDFQWGEVVTPSELDGINAFNVDVAIRRYRRLIERTIDLCKAHMVNPSYPGMIYLRGGDAVSGEIHQELRETNELQSIPAVRSLVEQEAWGIAELLKHFPRIRVISVPGNHGRTTFKPQSKRYAETNYDTLSAWMLESWFKAQGEKRVSFWTPESGDALFNVYGWKFLLTHGDRIGSRGGQGFIGPAATIARGMKKTRDFYATLGQSIDYILVGHFHTRMELEYGFANGCLPGYSEYARDFRAAPRPPEQWLFFVHPLYGVTARWPIILEKRAVTKPQADPWSTTAVRVA